MSKLPRISGRDCMRALERLGFYRKREAGSHVATRRDEPFARVAVPDRDELDRGTLRAVLRRAGLSVDEFPQAL